MKRWMLCALLLGMAGCRTHHHPAHPIGVFQAQMVIKPGMDEAEVLEWMGMPWDATHVSCVRPEFPSEKTTNAFLCWHEGNRVAEVYLENDRVKTVELKRYPVWALGFGTYGHNMADVKKICGPPDRSAKQVVGGKHTTVWIYTDKVESKRTLRLTFEANGRLQTTELGPNRSDYDELAAN